MKDFQDACPPIEGDISNLAAEYTLGLLRDNDRQRFEMLMAVNPAIRAFVLKWSSIIRTLEPPQAPASMPLPAGGSPWERLERRLDAEERVMGALHQHQFSVRESLGITIGALRVLRERLAAQRSKKQPDRSTH